MFGIEWSNTSQEPDATIFIPEYLHCRFDSVLAEAKEKAPNWKVFSEDPAITGHAPANQQFPVPLKDINSYAQEVDAYIQELDNVLPLYLSDLYRGNSNEPSFNKEMREKVTRIKDLVYRLEGSNTYAERIKNLRDTYFNRERAYAATSQEQRAMSEQCYSFLDHLGQKGDSVARLYLDNFTNLSRGNIDDRVFQHPTKLSFYGDRSETMTMTVSEGTLPPGSQLTSRYRQESVDYLEGETAHIFEHLEPLNDSEELAKVTTIRQLTPASDREIFASTV